MLKTTPAVFAVGNEYQIMVEVSKEAFFSVEIGGKTYYDEANGIMKSMLPIHRVSVPMDVLDREKSYTVCVRPIRKRKPYFTKTNELKKYSFEFKGVPEKDIRIYHISDAHNRIEEPVNAAKTFGQVDLLVLNGDIISHSGSPDKFSNIYEICAKITGGKVPVVFSRGNHDMRGSFAERFAEYTPVHNGNTYYTFRVGSIWGMLLDCGEDKPDTSEEYGFSVACGAFRERQTEYIKSVIRNAKEEYEGDGVKIRLVISHHPFTQVLKPPFDIEQDTYSDWARLLRENVKPHLMLCGHLHKCAVNPVGCENDNLGQPCTVVVGSEPSDDRFTGCGFVVKDEEIEIVFTDNLGNIVSKESVTITQ